MCAVCVCRTKLKQTEVDCELLKRCCETLTEENKRLQKELQELRAIKVAAPHVIAHDFYMPLPAATLTMCPSCERVATVDNRSVTTFAKKPGYSHFWDIMIIMQRTTSDLASSAMLQFFSSKAALVPKWSDFAEMMMQRRTSNVANSAMLQFSDWRPGLRIICACPNSLIFQRWWQCWEELPMCQVLQCYSFLIEGGSGDPFAYSNGVIF